MATIPIFGVAHGDVRKHHFPQLPGEFSDNSNPTDDTVTEMIEVEGAILSGRLSAEGGSATSINDDGGVDYPAAYSWCADLVRLGAAIRAFRAMTGQDPNVVKAWKEEYEQRYKDLSEKGLVVLGDAPLPAQSANGPRTHINEHSLDTGSEEDMSDVIPNFRRNDML